MVNDPIADFIIRIKNASMAGARTLSIPHSKIKENLAKILQTKGFIEKIEVAEDGKKKNLILTLSAAKAKAIEVKRISKPGRRVYIKAKDITKIRGLGLTIISTPGGLMTHKDALAKGLGGEVLCKII